MVGTKLVDLADAGPTPDWPAQKWKLAIVEPLEPVDSIGRVRPERIAQLVRRNLHRDPFSFMQHDDPIAIDLDQAPRVRDHLTKPVKGLVARRILHDRERLDA